MAISKVPAIVESDIPALWRFFDYSQNPKIKDILEDKQITQDELKTLLGEDKEFDLADYAQLKMKVGSWNMSLAYAREFIEVANIKFPGLALEDQSPNTTAQDYVEFMRKIPLREEVQLSASITGVYPVLSKPNAICVQMQGGAFQVLWAQFKLSTEQKHALSAMQDILQDSMSIKIGTDAREAQYSQVLQAAFKKLDFEIGPPKANSAFTFYFSIPFRLEFALAEANRAAFAEVHEIWKKMTCQADLSFEDFIVSDGWMKHGDGSTSLIRLPNSLNQNKTLLKQYVDQILGQYDKWLNKKWTADSSEQVSPKLVRATLESLVNLQGPVIAGQTYGEKTVDCNSPEASSPFGDKPQNCEFKVSSGDGWMPQWNFQVAITDYNQPLQNDRILMIERINTTMTNIRGAFNVPDNMFDPVGLGQ